jgi:hypothetical protein
VGAADHFLARSGLGLPKIEDCFAIGIGQVIGDPERIGFVVVLSAEVVPNNPSARTAERFALANRQPGLELPPVRLATGLEPAPGGARIQHRVQHPACHFFTLTIIGRPSCPAKGRYPNTETGKRARTVANDPFDVIEYLLDDHGYWRISDEHFYGGESGSIPLGSAS